MDIVDKREVPPSDDSRSQGYEFCLSSGKLVFQISDSMGKPFLTVGGVGPDLRDGAWHHVAVTVARSSTNGLVLYVDGYPVTTPFDPTSQIGDLSNTNFLMVGRHPSYPRIDCNFRGMIDEVSLYGRALTADEILAIFGAGHFGKCPVACSALPTGTISWWRAENTALDCIGSNHGTLTNGAAFGCGEVGRGFSFDGTGGLVLVPDSPS